MGAKTIYAAGLDIGSRKTRLAICVLEQDRLRIVGCAAVESQGWLKGRISDQRGVAASIQAALREAESCSGLSVESVVVGIGGPTVRGANGRGVWDMGVVREIDQRDVNRAMDRASQVQLHEDRMLLQMFPQDFVVDDHPGHSDPRRMLASRLEINVHLVTASVQEHNSLVGAVNQAHLAVEETVFEALAACYAAVLPEERREGVALIDIGAESTELVVYHGDALHLASTVKVCGDHFTRDMAHGLRVGFEEAEMVKLEYGCAIADDCPENIVIALPAAEGQEPKQGSQRFINRILQARGEQLFQFVRAELGRVGMERSLLGGVFLTGAAARLPDLWILAERMLGANTGKGLTKGILDWPESMDDPEWCTVAGLAMYSAKLKTQTEHAREAGGWLSRILK